MVIKQYIQMLTRIAEKFPNAEVIYSSDEEGNDFIPVIYSPTAGKLSNDVAPFIPVSELEDENEVNAVCIN